MTNYCYIGRAGRDAGELVVNQFDLNGDVATITGYGVADTETIAQVIRQQLLGLGLDETVVPVQFAQDATHDGFYEIGSIQVASPDRGMGQKAGVVEFQATLRRIAGYAYPLVQSTVSLFPRTNVHSVSNTSSAWWAIPGTPTEYIFRATTDTVATRTAADGAVTFVTNTTATATETVVASYGCRPSDFYQGSAKIEVGSDLYAAVGRQVDSTAGSPSNWRLTNGLIRVVPTLSGGVSTGGLTFRWYDGSSWEPSAGKAFTINDRSSGNAIGAFTTFRILRNTPELAVIRLSALAPGYSSNYYATIDLALRRGSRLVEVLCSGKISQTWQIRRASNDTAATVTGGVADDAADGDGNRWVIFNPATCTADTTNGRLGLTTGGLTSQFAVGAEITSSTASGTERAVANLILQYLVVGAESQKVVGR